MPSDVIDYSALAARVRALPPSCGPVRIVAIDGPSGAGKTTFARRLAAALGDAPLIGSDHFRVPWDASHPLVWWEPFRLAVLEPFASGRPGRLRRFNWKDGSFGPEEKIPPASVLLVEGVGAAWRESPAAYRIWVDAPRDVRRARVLNRDGEQFAEAWDGWTAREHALFEQDGTRARADLHIDGTMIT